MVKNSNNNMMLVAKTDGGLWLVGVDEAPDHSIFLWDWAKGTKQLETKV